MSLGLYLKMSLKQRVLRCGTAVETLSFTESMIQQKRESRRESRHSLIFKRRNITDMVLSPINSPIKSIKKQPAVQPSKADKRLQMLREWQANKKKHLQKQKALQKPLFKVCRVPETSTYGSNIERALKEIKGKPIDVNSKGVKPSIFPKFVPSSTHKFKPPANIKPIQLNNAQTRKQDKDVSKENKNFTNIMTRPNTRKQLKFMSDKTTINKVTNNKSKLSVVHNLKIEKNKHRRRSKQEIDTSTGTKLENEDINVQDGSKSSSSNEDNSDHYCSPIVNLEALTNTDSSESTESATPKPRPSTYTSPFVTVSRGKQNARREYEKKTKGESCDDGSSPQTVAAHFTSVVNIETNRLQMLCTKWNNYKEAEKTPEEVCDMINVAIGQTELLLNKKFKQFHNLIECCLTGKTEKPITSFDLHGFWDTAMLQVKNLDKRYENLDTLKLNNWEEILPVNKPKPKRKAPQRKTKITASSSLMNAIKEARKKQQQFKCEHERVIVPTTPSESVRRKSLRITALASCTKCKTCSPDVHVPMMHVTPHAKPLESPKSVPKSILKSGRKSITRKSLRKSKAVLFINVNDEDEEKENNVNVVNALTCCHEMPDAFTTPRRSARIFARK